MDHTLGKVKGDPHLEMAPEKKWLQVLVGDNPFGGSPLEKMEGNHYLRDDPMGDTDSGPIWRHPHGRRGYGSSQKRFL